MKSRSFDEVMSNGRHRHLLVGDAFIEGYGLGCDLGWIYDKLVLLDKDCFNELAVKRTESTLERIMERADPFTLLAVTDRVLRQVALKRMTRDCYPEIMVFIEEFDTYHSPTLMPMVEIMSTLVLELNLKREHEVEMQELFHVSKPKLNKLLEIYRENSPEAVGASIYENRDLEAITMLKRSADIRHSHGKKVRRPGDSRAFGSKLVYSLKKYDWRPGNYIRPEGQWHWKCQSLGEIDGDLYMLADDYLSLQPNDWVCELISSNASINNLHVVTLDGKVLSTTGREDLEKNKRQVRENADIISVAEEGEWAKQPLGNLEEGLAMEGLR